MSTIQELCFTTLDQDNVLEKIRETINFCKCFFGKSETREENNILLLCVRYKFYNVIKHLISEFNMRISQKSKINSISEFYSEITPIKECIRLRDAYSIEIFAIKFEKEVRLELYTSEYLSRVIFPHQINICMNKKFENSLGNCDRSNSSENFVIRTLTNAIEKKVDLRNFMHNGMNLLHLACLYGSENLLKIFLKLNFNYIFIKGTRASYMECCKLMESKKCIKLIEIAYKEESLNQEIPENPVILFGESELLVIYILKYLYPRETDKSKDDLLKYFNILLDNSYFLSKHRFVLEKKIMIYKMLFLMYKDEEAYQKHYASVLILVLAVGSMSFYDSCNLSQLLLYLLLNPVQDVNFGKFVPFIEKNFRALFSVKLNLNYCSFLPHIYPEDYARIVSTRISKYTSTPLAKLVRNMSENPLNFVPNIEVFNIN